MSSEWAFHGDAIRVPIGDALDRGELHRVCLGLAVQSGMGPNDAEAFAQAVAEIGLNCLERAGGGIATVCMVRYGARRGVRAEVRDAGAARSGALEHQERPPDHLAFGDAFTGLGSIFDEYSEDTRTGGGRVVVAIRWVRPAPPDAP